MRCTLLTFTLAHLFTLSAIATAEEKTRDLPNIVVILADDLGYGDIGAYNRESLIPTPNLDQLAAEGMRFTDAHSPSAVCTPTRYSLLTGRYAWRSRLKSGVLWGYSPLLIEPGRETLASLLSKHGYHTAGVGKWHLGLGNGEPDYFGNPNRPGRSAGADSGRLKPGPNDVGFDYFFGIPASLDMKPYVYIENSDVLSPLTGQLIASSSQRRHGGGGFWRQGQIAEGFVHEEVLPTIASRAMAYIRERESQDQQPFFLYFALTAPHTPWLPSNEFRGKSAAGHYGDFVSQVDAVVGQVVNALNETGEADNTLIIFTSDNGAHWLQSDIDQYGHLANGNLRGQKADIFEGGHRVPFIASWQGRVPEGTTNTLPITLADLFATIASIVGADPSPDAGPDSFDFLPTLLGNPDDQMPRAPMIHHSFDGMFAIRDGDWKLIDGLGSGGFTEPTRLTPKTGEEAVQLYNLRKDPAERDNVADENAEVVKKLLEKLAAIRKSDSSRGL